MLEQWWQNDVVRGAAVLLHSLGQTLFGGGLVTFALLYTFFRRAMPELAGLVLDRAFRTVSLAMSLGLTLVILGGVLRHQQETGSIFWQATTLEQQRQLLKAGCFLLLWFSWGYLEIVLLQTLRKGLAMEAPLELPGYLDSRTRIERSLWWQSGLFVLIALLGAR